MRFTGRRAPADFDLVISQIHGFTGSAEVFERNIPFLSKTYRVIAYDLRGHGKSDKPRSGYHVSRLAMDLKNLIDHLGLDKDIRAIGTSLGCAVLWYCFHLEHRSHDRIQPMTNVDVKVVL